MSYYDVVDTKGYYIIAEIGVNYYDIAHSEGITNLQAAKKMICEAHKAGIDAVKFQTYKAETLAAKCSPAYWDTKEEPTQSQYELFKKFDSFGYQEYKELKHYCDELGISFMSTPFDFKSADYLDGLMEVYKISSSDISNIPFIEYIAKKQKPIILSTGASNLEEIQKAVYAIQKHNKCKIALLHCVLEYPTPLEHANLNKITSLMNVFPECIIGYSDHTKPTDDYEVLATAYNLGAVVIEKHFTLDKTLRGNDHYHAMDVTDAKNIIEKLQKIKHIRGNADLVCLQTELSARKNARRSIVSACKIQSGETIQEDMLVYKRPGTGISPDCLQQVVGRKVVVDIDEDVVMCWEYLENEK